MKVLITGAGGFVGRHLANELSNSAIDLVLTSESAGQFTSKGGIRHAIRELNIRNPDGLFSVLKETSPDAIVHLAAISHVGDSEGQQNTIDQVNVIGTKNVCEAATATGKKIVFLFISSSLVYGSDGDSTPGINERTPTNPESVYGQSKLAGEAIVRKFKTDHFIPRIVRPFNHIGPGQNPKFACPAFARKIAEAGNGDKITVGNLNTYRDFTDVRDIVKGYRLILESDSNEDLFVLGSGKCTKMEDVFRGFVKLSEKNIGFEVDPSLLRTSDPKKFRCDYSLAKKVLGWSPLISLQQSLEEIYQEALLEKQNKTGQIKV